MTNLVETPQWEPGIYQLETIDPVQGGPNGIDNLQAKQLGNRTQFLKALIEAAQNSFAGHESATDPHSQYLTTAEGNSMIASAVSALVNSSPATLDTLNELATALGNDPNFATSMATALGNKQPLDATLTALAALTTAANKLIYATGADTFATADLTAFARTLLDDADAAAMRATLGIQNLEFGASLSSNGYQKLPSGLIIQWGNSSSLGTGSPNCSVTFPVAFPNACFASYATLSGTTQGGYVNSNPGATKTTGIFTLFNAGGSITSAWSFQWISIGW